jgi:hypothetical protein
MSMVGESWCPIKDIESKFGVSKDLVLQWVKDGILRSEEKGGEAVRVYIDDPQLKIEEDFG